MSGVINGAMHTENKALLGKVIFTRDRGLRGKRYHLGEKNMSRGVST